MNLFLAIGEIIVNFAMKLDSTMNTIAAHLEYLLRKHDCVVLPGMGALLCNYVPAHFDDAAGGILNPPGRALAFNELLSDSDGLLAASIARKEGITYEAGVRRMNEEVEMLRRQLDDCGEFQLGRLGRFYRRDGRLGFVADSLPSVNGFFYGLKPVAPVPLAIKDGRPDVGSVVSSEEATVMAHRDVASRRFRRSYATGIVASLAVLVTIAMFLLPHIKIDKSVQMASIAPVPSASVVERHIGNPADSKVFVDEPDAAEAPHVVMEEAPAGVTVCPEYNAPAAAVEASPAKVAEPAGVNVRFNESDPYCVIVASFPSRTQAETYIRRHSAGRLGILEKDDKFRVFAATAATYGGANEQKKLTGQSDAWVCRR